MDGTRSPYYQYVEAETFDAEQGAVRQDANVGGLRDGDWIAFHDMDFGAALPKLLQVTSSSGSNGAGTIRFRLDSPTGQEVASHPVGNTGGWDKFITRQAGVDPADIGGVHDLYLTMDANHDDDFVNIDKFIFQVPGVPFPDASSPTKQNFIVHCGYDHTLHDDPIVHPGKPGGSHSHDFFGAKGVNARSTKEELQAADSTCAIAGDTASYWAPSLIDPNGNKVPPVDNKVYYQVDDTSAVGVIAPPADLKMITGDVKRPERKIATWRCVGGGEQPAEPGDNQHDMTVCPPGHNVQVTLPFPNCWNGTDLDSPDHRSHMAYAEAGACPSSHPVRIAQVLPEIEYATRGGVGYRLASGDATTAHADFWNTWDQDKLEREVAVCLNRGLVCGLSG